MTTLAAVAALGHADGAEHDRVMADQGRAAVFIQPTLVYSN